MDKEHYESPSIEVIGSVEDLTKGLDKVGSAWDQFSTNANSLDGSIIPDPRPVNG